MGSRSDYKVMKLCEKTLKNLGVLYEIKIIYSTLNKHYMD